ncbi:MAG: response regulator [SAR324 cluster bacterium]|nr:response regulator [SAR324 cluster bacterium]
MKILIAEDQQEILDNLTHLLEEENHEVVQARNGKEAWKKLSEDPYSFNVILTDIMMPVMNGLQLLQRIRNDENGIPMIIMTGDAGLDLSIEALKSGVFDFLIKPFDFDRLLHSLSHLETINSKEVAINEVLPFVSGKIEVSLWSQTRFITSVASYLDVLAKPFCQRYRINGKQFRLCLDEAITNAIIHGNLEVPSIIKEESFDVFDEVVKEREGNPEYKRKEIFVRFAVTSRNPHLGNSGDAVTALEIEVEDQGVGFDTTDLPNPNDPNSLLCSGRGILLIRSIMDEVYWNDKGNCITMIKYLA